MVRGGAPRSGRGGSVVAGRVSQIQVPALLVIIPALVLMFMLTLVMTKVQSLIMLILWVSMNDPGRLGWWLSLVLG